VIAVITFPLQHLLAQLVILVAGLVAVDVNQSPLAVRDEIMVLVQDIPQLPQDQLEGLRLVLLQTFYLLFKLAEFVGNDFVCLGVITVSAVPD